MSAVLVTFHLHCWSSCCSQLVQWEIPPEASTTHKVRASYYLQSVFCCSVLLLQMLFKCSERMDVDSVWGIFYEVKEQGISFKTEVM